MDGGTGSTGGERLYGTTIWALDNGGFLVRRFFSQQVLTFTAGKPGLECFSEAYVVNKDGYHIKETREKLRTGRSEMFFYRSDGSCWGSCCLYVDLRNGVRAVVGNLLDK